MNTKLKSTFFLGLFAISVTALSTISNEAHAAPFSQMAERGKIKRQYGEEAAKEYDRQKSLNKSITYNNFSPTQKAQADYQAFFANPVGTTKEIAGGTVTLISAGRALFTDKNGQVSEFGWKDSVLNVARKNESLANEWSNIYGLDSSPSNTGRYWKNGEAFNIPENSSIVEIKDHPNQGQQGLLYTAPNGMKQTLVPEHSLSSGFNEYQLNGNKLTGTYVHDPKAPGKAINFRPEMITGEQNEAKPSLYFRSQLLN